MANNSSAETVNTQVSSTQLEKPIVAQKSILLPLIGSFLLGSFITAGAIYAFAPSLLRFLPTTSPTPAVEGLTSSPSPVVTASPLPAKTIHLPFKNFATFLEQNCKKISDGYIGVSMKDVPLSSDFFSAEFTPSLIAACSNPENVGSSYLSLAQDLTALYLYGEQSKELGHGGAPFIGKVGQFFRSSGDIETYIYIAPPSACGITLEGITLRARSIRTMRAADGSPVYLLYEKSIADPGDSRLQALFEDSVQQQNEECPPTIALDEVEIDKKALEFVKKLSATDSIRKNIDQVEAGLRSVVSN